MFLDGKSFPDAMGNHTRQVTTTATIELSPSFSAFGSKKTMLWEKVLGLGRSHGGRGVVGGKSYMSQGASPEMEAMKQNQGDKISIFPCSKLGVSCADGWKVVCSSSFSKLK